MLFQLRSWCAFSDNELSTDATDGAGPGGVKQALADLGGIINLG